MRACLFGTHPHIMCAADHVASCDTGCRNKKCGIFRLSTPGGLQLVQQCTLRGFHPHPTPSTGQPVYELCGHVFLNPRAKHSVIDLR
jgi:hypothetical protein